MRSTLEATSGPPQLCARGLPASEGLPPSNKAVVASMVPMLGLVYMVRLRNRKNAETSGEN